MSQAKKKTEEEQTEKLFLLEESIDSVESLRDCLENSLDVANKLHPEWQETTAKPEWVAVATLLLDGLNATLSEVGEQIERSVE